MSLLDRACTKTRIQWFRIAFVKLYWDIPACGLKEPPIADYEVKKNWFITKLRLTNNLCTNF